MPAKFEIENGTLLRYNGEEHSIVIPEGVRAIGKGVFKGMEWITDVVLPDGITEIGDNAFKGCRQLAAVNFPEGLQRIGDFAFHRCHALKSAVLPDSVTELGYGVFLYCDNLREIRAKGVRAIKKQTFANNTQLCELSLHSEIDCSNFGDDIFTGCIRIQKICLSDGFTFEADNLISVFQTEHSVHPVVRAIAESVYHSLKIENGVLYKLHVDLRTFELPEGIRCIEKGCFFDKKGIVSITFPESLARIRSNAFGNCINLEQITFRSENIEIDDGAFRGCSSLKRIVIGGRMYTLGGICYEAETPFIIRKISDQVMSDFYISGNILMAYAGSEERVTIPEGVEIIGESCFEGNDRIDRVILSSTVREIHENAFRSCVRMQSAVLPDGLQIICRSAFENCKKLIRFNVPSALQTVGFAAFRGCRSLELTQFETETPEAVHEKERIYGKEDIAAYSFCDHPEITELVFERPAIIGKYAFSSCPNLTSVIIRHPDCIIEKHAFEKCGSLRKIQIFAGKIEKGAFCFCRNLETAEIRGVRTLEDEVFAGCSALQKVTLSDELTEIGNRCFDECISLRNIDLHSVRRIGERAFERCDNLHEIVLNGQTVGYHAFADCAALKTIILDADTMLQSGVFSGCTCADTVVFEGIPYPFSQFSQSRNSADNQLPLKVQEVIGSVYSCFEINRNHSIVRYRGDAVTVHIPEDIVSAEDEAFRDHLRVTDIQFPACFRYSGKLTFAGTGWIEKRRIEDKFNIVNGMLIDAFSCGEIAEIPENLERICSWAFAGNTVLKKLILKNERLIVDVFAFRNCINLRTIQYSDGKIYTLEHIRDLTEKTYPEFVRRIFSECINCFKLNENGVLEESTGNIKNLVFPRGITEIQDQVYMDCNLLESIVLSPETVKIGKSAFKNSKWLRSIQNAGGVVRIEAQAFSGCKSLERIDLSDTLEFLGKRTFEHCCNLTEIHLSDQITVIPERAFFRCKSLRKIVIPESVRQIEAQAFAFCSELEEVIFRNPNSVSVADDAFAWCEKL